MIYVIGSHHRTTELTNQEIFLIGAASGTQGREGIGAVFFLYLLETLSY
jgi:hypothetical protein